MIVKNIMIPSKKPRGGIKIVRSDIRETKSMVSDLLQVNQILSLPLGVTDAFM